MGFRDHCYSIFNTKYYYISIKKIPFEKQSGKIANNIGVSKFVENYLIKEKMRNHQVIYNTSLLEIERKRDDYILFTGRPTREKGFDVFLEVVKAFPKEHFAALLLTDKSLTDLPENLKIYGNIPYDNISTVYEKAKMLISPSLFEGNSYSILEALKGDIPIIASNVGLIWEFDKIPGKKILRHSGKNYISAVRDILNEGTYISPKTFFNDNFSPHIIKKNWKKVLGDIF